MTARQWGRVFVAGVVTLGCVVALAGCFSFRANLPGTVRGDLDATQTKTVGQVDESFTHYYFVHGLFGAPDPNLLDTMVRQAAAKHGANGLKDVEIEATYTYVGIALTIATFSMVHPRRYRIRGTLVDIAAPPVPGKTLTSPE